MKLLATLASELMKIEMVIFQQSQLLSLFTLLEKGEWLSLTLSGYWKNMV